MNAVDKKADFDYYYKEESEQYVFFKIPKMLFTETIFKQLSAESKLLYGLFIDRMGLSRQNGWTDKNGRVFIYFTIESAKEVFGFSDGKTVKIFKELDDIGLIERVKQGLGKPAKIYVKNFAKINGKIPRETKKMKS